MSEIITYRKGLYCPKCWSKKITHHYIYKTTYVKKENQTAFSFKILCLDCGHSQTLT